MNLSACTTVRILWAMTITVLPPIRADNAACALMSRRLLPDGAVRLIILHHVVLLQSMRKGDDGNVRHRPLLKGSQLIYSAFSFFFLL
jgi:hypothetical protein